MNYSVGGISRSLPEWAKTLGVSEYAMIADLRHGKSIQEVVQTYATDTFGAESGPRAGTRQHCFLVTHAAAAPNPSTFSIVGDCRTCMAKAKDYYDSLHSSHGVGLVPEAQKAIQDEKDYQELLALAVNEEYRVTPAPEHLRADVNGMILSEQKSSA